MYDLVVVLHVLGLAALIGGYFVVARERSPRPNLVMLWGARAQVVTGLILVGLAEGAKLGDGELNHTKIAVKLLVALGALALTEIASGRSRRTKKADVATMTHAAGALGVLNVLVAIIW